jgi:tRNA threonylcarbamoyladenosine biosynthesis protein TsaB
MIILSCDTSTLLGSVAIHKDGLVVSQKSLFRQNSHSDSLNLLIQDCLSEAKIKLDDVDVFATGLGPGSFTGIRISFNTIKTFASVFDKPMAGVNSLENLAFQNKHLSSDICCAINAFKNMVYIATYGWDGNSLIETRPPQVVRVQMLDDFLQKPILFVGDAFEAYEKYLSQHCSKKIIRNSSAVDFPNAKTVGDIVGPVQKFFHWSKLTPLYLRASEAEENLNGIKYQPL